MAIPIVQKFLDVGAIKIATDNLQGIVEFDFDSDFFTVVVTNTNELQKVTISMNLLQDAFKRLEVANPLALADYTFKYDLLPLLFDTVETGGGTVTHLPNESSVRLRCDTASGDVAMLCSRRYHRYQPGKGGKISMTCVPGDGKANVRKRWGFFDDENGLFFEVDGTTLSVVQRSKATGSVVDTKVAQANFNVDKVDGNGTSGFNLDLSKANIFEIDFQWLGVGDVVFKIVDGSNIPITLHTVANANSFATVYMTTANLPIRYAQENTGTAVSKTDLIAICSTVVSSGGEDPPEFEFGWGNEVAVTTTDATETHLISYRLASSFNGLDNRMIIFPKDFTYSSDLGSCIFRTYLNSTITGGSWVAVNSESGMEYNITPSSFASNMPILFPVQILSSGGNPNQVSRSTSGSAGLRKLAMTRSAGNGSSDIITITIQRLTGSNVDAMAGMRWGEAR